MKKIKELDSFLSKSFYPSSSYLEGSKRSEFKEILEGFWDASYDVEEEYKVILPEHGVFWDDGQNDVRQV